MEPNKLKELVIGSINNTFNTWVDVAAKASNGDGKAIPAIHGMQKSIVAAASSVDARVYADNEFSAKTVLQGIDLAYRAAAVSDATRDDEWIAALAIDFQNLDEHTRKVLHSNVDPQVKNSNLGGAATRRLLLSLVCAKKTVTLDPFFTVVVETSDKKLALIPAPPAWAIPQPNGQNLVINYMEAKTYQERLDIASRRLSVIDSAAAATLMNAHVRGESGGRMH
jgi:hypothetical protein